MTARASRSDSQLVATVALAIDDVFLKTAIANQENRASTGASGASARALARFPPTSEKTTTATDPVMVRCNTLPGSMTVMLVGDVQARSQWSCAWMQ